MSAEGAAVVVAARTRTSQIRLPGRAMGAVLLVTALVAAAVADRFSFGAGPWLWQLDMPKIDFPLASFFHAAISTGQLPLWNDDLGLGFPLYAEGQIGAFYPPNWLFFQLDPLSALDAIRIVHLTLAGVGCGLIALRLGGSRTGALVACLVAALGGAITTKLEWTNVVEAYGWLPWVLLPLLRRSGPTRGGLVLAGLAWGVQALAGHPNVWLLTGVAAVVALLAASPNRRGLSGVIGFGLLGGAIGSIQLIPTLVLTALSVRSAGVSADDLFTSSTTGFDPLGLGFANAFATSSGSGWDIHTAWYPDGIFALLESSAYVTLSVVALACLGARTRRARPLLAIALVLAAIPIVAAFRPSVWTEIPILDGLRSPVRAYLVVAIMLGLLASLGVTRVGRTRRGFWLAVVAVVGLIVGYLGCLVIATALPGTFDTLLQAFATNLSPDDADRNRILAVSVLSHQLPFVVEAGLGVGALVLLGASSWPQARSRSVRLAVRGALLVAAAAPLVFLSPSVNTTAPLAGFSSGDTSFVSAARAADAHRLVTIGEPGWYEGMPDQLAMAGVPDLNMFSSLNLQASDRLLSDVRDTGPAGELLRKAVGVDTLITFGDATCPGATIRAVDQPRSTICRIPALRPPYWIPASAVSTSSATGPAGAGAAPIDPRGWAAPGDVTIDLAAAVAAAHGATITSWGASGGSFAVDAPSDGWVWIDRAWWAGWQNSVDGTPVTARRALAGQLIPVSAGHHVIEQRLIPWDALAGVLVALAALLAALAWLVRGRRSAA